MENSTDEQKRQLKKMGALDEQGAPTRTQPAPRPAKRERTSSRAVPA